MLRQGQPEQGMCVTRFIEQRDEAVFDPLVRRHGPMVWVGYLPPYPPHPAGALPVSTCQGDEHHTIVPRLLREGAGGGGPWSWPLDGLTDEPLRACLSVLAPSACFTSPSG